MRIGELVNIYLNSVAKARPAPTIARTVEHLRFASSPTTPINFWSFAGAGHQAADVIKIFHHFTGREQMSDRTKILKSAAKEWHDFRSVAKFIESSGLEYNFSKEPIWGIPHGEHLKFADKIEDGNNELSIRIRRAADEPPFRPTVKKGSESLDIPFGTGQQHVILPREHLEDRPA
ncbi:hypothetical protein [Streptomyces sp. CA-146814]|uniref:hypothetical protein n=1 Tax=Streptomyces sp. CA-146814 TaxID=3240053 RepID=UPI003D89C5FC